MRVTLIMFALVFASQAQADAKADIAYRQSVMETVHGNMGAMVAILKGGVHKQNFEFHARSMAELAKIVPEIFPAGSDEGKTDALPAIWQKPDDFKHAVQKFVDAANGLEAASKGGDMGEIGPAVNALGQACKHCHDNFRREHKHD